MKKLILILIALVMFVPESFAQKAWDQKGAFPSSTLLAARYNKDGHGIAVDPDGRIWYQPYYATDSVKVTTTPANYTGARASGYVDTRVLYVFNPDGTQASFSPIRWIDLPGGKRDTLGGVTYKQLTGTNAGKKAFDANTGRGLRVDHEGNIIASYFNLIYRINYKTGAGMNKVEHNPTTIGTNGARGGASIIASAVDKNGNIFAATVAPGSAIKIFDKNFALVGNARNKSIGFSRSMEVSKDGNTIYWAGYTNHAIHLYGRADEFSPFDSLGPVLLGFDSESVSWHPTTGHLWASAGSSADAPNRFQTNPAQISTLVKTSWKRRTWYSFDASKLTPKVLTDAETPIESLTWQPTAAADTLGRPRGIAFSPDGKTAYAVTFANGGQFPTLQKFTAPVAPTGRMITATLNTAAIPDTVTTKHNIRILGGGGALPDGNNMTWDDKSTLAMANIGGDYWQSKFYVADNTAVDFKYRDFDYNGKGFNDGWEDGDNSKIASGTGNLDLGTHFFKVAPNGGKAYNWKPFRAIGADSVGVWFRVFMNTADGTTKGYDSDKGAKVGVRGSNFDPDDAGPLTGKGPLDWGASKVMLKPESTDSKAVGFHIYSGLAVYPKSEIGKKQPYKYVVEGTSVGWENDCKAPTPCDGGNRGFKVPKSDSTVQWVRFSNSKPLSGVKPTEFNVSFAVDLSPLEKIGMFSRADGDSLQVRGDFNGWGCSKASFDKCLLDKVPGSVNYERAVKFKLIPQTAFSYKYFLDYNDKNFGTRFNGAKPPSGWEEPLNSTGANRGGVYDGAKDQVEKTATFNDVETKNLIPTGKSVDVKFRVDMKPVTKGINSANAAQPFDPTAGDSVFVSFGDPIWLFTQKQPLKDGNPVINKKFFLTDADKDGIYEGVLKVSGPTYNALQYQYSYGQKASIITEEGGGFSGLGRRRVRYIYPSAATKDANGVYTTWPAAQNASKFEEEKFIPKGSLPYDKSKTGGLNPVDVEPIDSVLPTQVTLSANYPNPFNPSTSFEYTLNRQAQVKVQIYDLTGRLVQTLVNEMQSPSTYRVSFDATNMASGVYIYRLQVGDQVLSRKMTFLK